MYTKNFYGGNGIVGAQVRYMYYLSLLLFYIDLAYYIMTTEVLFERNRGIAKNTLYPVRVFEMVYDLHVYLEGEMYMYI